MKSGPDVFADALVPSGRIRPRNAPVPLAHAFRHLALALSQSLYLYPDHRWPVPSGFAGCWVPQATALVEGLLVEYEPVPGVYLLPWSVSVEKTLARLR